ncbi:CBASS cGAMP-activated phospholipase [Rhodococcus sp. NPDC057135]|uniref:CBASS cGAMP-activated phospholipase n=1 Tax=Rhodococcus sp. NPDC057135 TaxID=3346028 RepID=UPI00363F6A46
MAEYSNRKILSIDGGGIKGVFPAAFLAEIEKTLGKPIVEHFDMIVGTSTGGIIALGLGMGLSAQEILNFYEEHGPDIFGGNRKWKVLRQIGGAKYDPLPLRKALVEVFGDRQLGESRTRLVVPSLNLETGEVHVFKTAHHQRFVRDYREKVVDVAMATAAAPTYFPTHRLDAGVPLIDGGMWANNPMGPAAVEALGVLGWDAGKISLLSVGCTTAVANNTADRTKKLGVNYWASRLLNVVMSGQSSSSNGTAQLLLGHDNVHRISPIVDDKRFSLDGVKNIESLRGLGSSEARKAYPLLEQTFFIDKSEPFVPLKSLDHIEVSK